MPINTCILEYDKIYIALKIYKICKIKIVSLSSEYYNWWILQLIINTSIYTQWYYWLKLHLDDTKRNMLLHTNPGHGNK